MTSLRVGAALSTSMKLVAPPEPIPILYIEDDPDDVVHLETALEPNVVNPVIAFQTSQELYDYLDMNQGPFIIVVDLVLWADFEKGGGYHIIRTLRKRPDINETRSPIVAVTGTQHDDMLSTRVRQAGADAFLIKPLSAGDLATAIGRPGWFRVELTR